MKKVFSFVLVACMVIGIGISIANFTSVDLEAKDIIVLPTDPQQRYPGNNWDCWPMPWDCDVVSW